jgi:hypothetical protein
MNKSLLLIKVSWNKSSPPHSQAYALPVQAGPYVAPHPVDYPPTNGAEHTKISPPPEKEEA